MALDQIWKQQLTLVSYGNEFLSQNLSIQRWIQHSIFNQHSFNFRDLNNQHLLAQHFQIWLEGLKKQGVYKLSLHSSSILNDEQNPNANVELLPITHFIVSHEKQKKYAWIFGKELAEWYQAEHDYEAPIQQRSNLRHETFWRFELNAKLIKRVEQDLTQPDWDEIQSYMENELFESKLAQGFQTPLNLHLPYYGNAQQNLEQQLPISSGVTQSELNTDSGLNLSTPEKQQLPLLPADYSADYAHESLHRLDSLANFIGKKIQHPHHPNGTLLSSEEQLNLRHFSQKLESLSAKFIVKVANHYKTAKLTPKEIASPFDGNLTNQKKLLTSNHSHDQKSGKYGVISLILLTIVICFCAYYFGF